MSDFSNTTKFNAIQLQEMSHAQPTDAKGILLSVYSSLQAKGYDPISQLVGYLISGDPTYITSYNGARSTITRLERDEIIEELVSSYISEHGR